MWEILLEALVDSLKLLPVLLVVYLLIELVEIKTAGKWKYNKVLKGKYAPVIGSAVGLIPQCGFSVVATDLFTKNIISVGTLMAVFISTSDEALPIMISNPSSIKYLLPMLLIKFLVASLVGYILYFVTKNKNPMPVVNNALVKKCNYIGFGAIDVKNVNTTQNYLVADIHMEDDFHDKGCCGHDIENSDKSLNIWQRYFKHPITHCLKIFTFILITNVVLNIVMHYAGDAVTTFLNKAYFAQPFVSALVGLIPNCASSVIITQLFVSGSLSFGGCIAGLCANAGIALAVLIKQNKSTKNTIAIITILYVISSVVGVLVSLIW